MTFTTHSTTFSTNYWSLDSVRTPSQQVRLASSTTSVYTGAGGSRSWIYVSHSIWDGSVGSTGLVGRDGIQTNKETMQGLNDRLTSYIDKVKSLETENRRLESKIQEYLEKKGPRGIRAWGHYFKTIEDLKAQIFVNSVDNARIILQINNACLATDDFRVKYETELAMHQSVESDICGLCKVVDDTNITWLQRETEIEVLKEELLFVKNYERKSKV